MVWPMMLGGALVLVGSLAGAWRERGRARAAARQALDAEAGRQEAVRLLRLAASELRAPALTLAGMGGSAAGLSGRLLELAESMQALGDDPSTRHRLEEETVALRPLLDFVVEQVRGSLAPGARAWRLSPGLDGVRLVADRRALHQVLLRVVSAAALATREGDWIDIAPAPRADGWGLAIEDEGLGLPIGDLADHGPESRGLGLGLTLARRLMAAHGGSLLILSAEKVGTRAVLVFPPERVSSGG